MANFTPNYNLKKPTQLENYNIDDSNGNADIIDSTLKELNDNKLGKTETATNSAKLNGHADTYFSPSTHNHNNLYLGINGTAVNADKVGNILPSKIVEDNGRVIKDPSDFLSNVKSGFYGMNGANANIPAPDCDYGTLLSAKNSNTGFQILNNYKTSDLYTRSWLDTSILPWRRLLIENDPWLHNNFLGKADTAENTKKVGTVLASDVINGNWLSRQALTDVNTLSKGVNFNFLTAGNPGTIDGSLVSLAYSEDFATQMFGDWRTNKFYTRGRAEGNWGSWKELADQADVDALKNKPTNTTIDATIATGWTATGGLYYKDVANSGFKVEYNAFTKLNKTITDADYETVEDEYSKIKNAVVYDNLIRFYALEKPTVAIPVKITILY